MINKSKLPIDLPQTDRAEPMRRICGVAINQLSKRLGEISTTATAMEVEAMRFYDEEKIEHYGYFEDFYKLWSMHEIQTLRSKLAEKVIQA